MDVADARTRHILSLQPVLGAGMAPTGSGNHPSVIRVSHARGHVRTEPQGYQQVVLDRTVHYRAVYAGLSAQWIHNVGCLWYSLVLVMRT